MRTKVTERGQVSIPAEIRRQLGIGAQTSLALRRSGKRGAVGRLLAERRKDARRGA